MYAIVFKFYILNKKVSSKWPYFLVKNFYKEKSTLVFRDSAKCSSKISLRSAPMTSSNDKTIEPSGGPNSFRASWKTNSRFSESTLCTSTSSMAKMGL